MSLLITGALTVGGIIAAGAAVRRVWAARKPSSSSGSALEAMGLRFDGPPEPYTPVESELGCDPTPKPGVVKFRDWVMANFGGYDAGIPRACNDSDRPNPSGHKLGRAWDFGWAVLSPQQLGGLKSTGKQADVDKLIELLLANDGELIRRSGVTYMIWQRRIWSTTTRAWQPYSGPDPHTDHLHLSFGTAGAMGKTSLYRAIGGGSPIA